MRRRQLLRGCLAAAALAASERPASAATGRVRVAVFAGRGVHPLALAGLCARPDAAPDLRLFTVSAADIRGGALADADAVVFTGGIASAQARDLGDLGRRRVREFVAAGGGYLGMCAGSCLALRDSDPARELELALVAGRNLTAGAWLRGVAALRLAADGVDPFRLHYANGPVFAAARAAGLPPYVALARFIDEVYSLSRGTHPGPMSGAPAIVAAPYGRGRVLLFSPNPTLGGRGVARSDLALAGLRWAAAAGPVPPDISFTDVFS